MASGLTVGSMKKTEAVWEILTVAGEDLHATRERPNQNFGVITRTLTAHNLVLIEKIDST